MEASLRLKVVAGQSLVWFWSPWLIFVVLVSYKVFFAQTKLESFQSMQKEGLCMSGFQQKGFLEASLVPEWAAGRMLGCCSSWLISSVLVSYTAVFTQTNAESPLSKQEEGAVVFEFYQKQAVQSSLMVEW